MTDLAQRFRGNPILRPCDIAPSIPGMQIECLLNPGVFRFEGKTWLLLRVAERPEQTPGQTSFPVLDESGGLKILEFDNADPLLDLSDPRVISYAGQDYLTTMSHLRLVASDDGEHFREPRPNRPIFGAGDLESYGIAGPAPCASLTALTPVTPASASGRPTAKSFASFMLMNFPPATNGNPA